MKVKHVLILLFLSLMILSLGAMFKTFHWKGANILILLGTGIQCLFLLLGLWKLLTMQRFRDYLNS